MIDSPPMPLKESHIVSAFDQELKDLSRRLVAMNDHSCAMLSDAITLLSSLDEDKAHLIIKDDEIVDQKEEEVSLFAVKLLALRQPMADDLRFIVSAIRIANDIERIADYASSIAESVLYMKKKIAAPANLISLGKATLTMLTKTSQLLTNPSSSTAIHLWHQDDEVDQLYLSLFKELVQQLAQSTHEDETQSLMQYIFMAKTFERVGDRITNVSEAVYYQRKGSSLARAIHHDS